MKTRKLSVVIEFEDNDFLEHKIRNSLKSNYHLTDKELTTLPQTEHLKDNKHYKKLLSDVIQAKKNLSNFINKNRL